MKTIKLFLLMFVAVILMTACEKKMTTRNGDDPIPDPIPIPSGWTYKYAPEMMIQDNSRSATFNGGSGVSANYTYYHRLALNNFKINPYVNGPLSALFVPHVGPGGTLIYENVQNDATYTITTVKDGYAYVSVTTNNVTSTGCVLEWNLSIGNATGNPQWALAYGNFAKLGPTYNQDDGKNNVYSIRYFDGQMYPTFH